MSETGGNAPFHTKQGNAPWERNYRWSAVRLLCILCRCTD